MRLPAENTCPCACHGHGGSHPCSVEGGCGGHLHPSSDGAQNHAERPGWACLTCHPPTDGRPWRRANEGYRTCAGCALRLRDQLIEITERYALMTLLRAGRGRQPRPADALEHRVAGPD